MADVTYEHVTKRFGDVIAISDLNIEVRDEEFLVLVGPSGCGKSTALRMLAGLEDVTEGIIRIGDRVVNDIPPKDRDIAMVFQSYALYPHMTVFDNMAFGLKLRRTPSEEIQRRVNTGAELLGIEDLLDRRPRQLSGGQRQRVAVGRAIVREPEVFLMDEPLSNLDAKLRVQARAEIVKIHRRLATTFIYVTHDQVEAMTMGSRIAVLKDGILQQIDTPQNLYEQPDNVFVGGFIGSPAMNFFNCTVVDVNGELKVDVGPFKIQVPSEKMAALGPYKEKKVVMGIRPEDIHDPDYVPAKVKEQTVPTHVEVTELMGNEVFLNLSTEGLEYVARVDPRTSAKMGVDMSVVMNVDNVHIFDAETEEAIR